MRENVVMSAVEYALLRKTLRKLQKDIDQTSSKFCIQINMIVIDLDRLEKKEKKNVVQTKGL